MADPTTAAALIERLRDMANSAEGGNNTADLVALLREAADLLASSAAQDAKNFELYQDMVKRFCDAEARAEAAEQKGEAQAREIKELQDAQFSLKAELAAALEALTAARAASTKEEG